MATYHCSLKSAKSGSSASAHADYIERENKYSNREDLIVSESGNMPSWAVENPSDFWKASDENERANGRVYTEIEIALPNELSRDQQVELVRDFVQEQLGEKHPYTWAIHAPKAALEDCEQPHAHIMFSERTMDGIDRPKEQFFKRAAAPYVHRKTKERVEPTREAKAKAGAGKDRTWNDRGKIEQVREAWANTQNRHLAKAGHEVKVDHRSLQEQGLERVPEPHLGGQVIAQVKQINGVDQLKQSLGRGVEIEHQQGTQPVQPVCSVEQPQAEGHALVDAPDNRLEYLNKEITRRFNNGDAERDKEGILKLIEEREKLEDPVKWGREKCYELSKQYNQLSGYTDETSIMKRAELRGMAREICKETGCPKPDFIKPKQERSRGIEMDM